MLFLVGGDGTQFAGNLLYEAAKRHALAVSIVGIPKSIDNDLWSEKGPFETISKLVLH